MIGMTPLLAAAKHGHSNVVQVLVAAGADLEKQDSCGDTPIFLAAYHGRTETVEVLLKAGAKAELAGRSLLSVAMLPAQGQPLPGTPFARGV